MNTENTQQINRLTVTFRIEPGCLGPQGADHVIEFCNMAQLSFSKIEEELIHWEIIPRFDKSLDEIEFKLGNKILNLSQTQKYFNVINKSLNDTEDLLHNKIADLIDEFMQQSS